MKKKLIEVALPLEAINKEAAREKSIRHGHPSTLHLWWSRKPLAACRAVLFASLIDDPSGHPEQFPTEETREKERRRLFDLIEELVKWENINNEGLYAAAYEEILKSTDGNPPPVLDPFAGGGSIPLEAQRLGLEAHASDLNPVAVLINKALIEIPPRFANMAPVNPESRAGIGGTMACPGACGLADDVAYYGEWMKQEAFKRVGHLYPKAKLPNGGEATVIAWKWARTVKCPNPACGAEMPLVNSYWLSKKKDKEAWVLPKISDDKKSVVFEMQYGKGDVPEGTVNRRGARCVCCGQPVEFPYIRSEGRAGRMSARMMAIVSEGQGGRLYLSPDSDHIRTAHVERPKGYPDAPLPHNPRDFKTPNYGMSNYADLFTPRQLTALTAFSDLVKEAVEKAQTDAIVAGLPEDDVGLEAGGKGAQAYGEAVGVYLACAVDKLLDRSSSLCSWDTGYTKIRNTFGRQALPMVWDYAEGNPFSDSTGCWVSCVEWNVKYLQSCGFKTNCHVSQNDASKISECDKIVISTDPPYYDNIGYADLSDFFYIWLRQSLKEVYPTMFSTMLVPKSEELVATPYRFDGNAAKAKAFFENGMLKAFEKMRQTTSEDYPLTVYYAFKQSESSKDENGVKTASTGWESMLQALIKAGFIITGTWPMRTEMMNRSIARDSNALASSIALVCRPRPEDASTISRRAFMNELREALQIGLHNLQSGNIAPVDLSQASIGPGMEVYSKYAEVLEADGKPMDVRAALILINQELDAYFSAQEGGMDTESRFCIAWFEQFGLAAGKYGDAETMARARLANLQELVNDGVLESGRGIVRLKKRNELPEKWDSERENTVWTMVQQLCRRLETQGMDKTAGHLLNLSVIDTSNTENIKALAYRAYITAERNGWADEALAYNSLVTSWPDLTKRMNAFRNNPAILQELDFGS
ncbi:MAG: DUF1156 domain-containing protein [Peptococcaceae bacterium]|nr:DUF1156 domain-containing protein [Peptococcaceae bacterium]